MNHKYLILESLFNLPTSTTIYYNKKNSRYKTLSYRHHNQIFMNLLKNVDFNEMQEVDYFSTYD